MPSCKICNKNYKTNHNNPKCENVLLKKEITDLKEEHQKMIIKTRTMEIERQLYIGIIKKYTSLDLSNIIEYKENEVNIFNLDDLIKLDNVFKVNIYSNKREPVKEPVKEVFVEPVKEVFVETEKTNKEIVKTLTTQEILRKKKDVFDFIEKNTNVVNKIKLLKKYNKNLYINLRNLKKYKDIILEDYKKIERILKNKKTDEEKIKSYFEKYFLNTIDYRLLLLKDFNRVNIDVHDIHEYTVVLGFENTEWSPFCYESFLDCLLGYNFALRDIDGMIRASICEKYPGIIYRRHNDRDLYYILDKIECGKRYWKQDTNLYDLSCKLSNSLFSDMITNFRKIYFEIFGDNMFRKNFLERSNLLVYITGEMRQMLDNILTITQNEIVLSKILMEIVKEKNYIEDNNDIFDYMREDNDVKIIFGDFDENSKITEIKKNAIRIIFDNVPVREIVDFKHTPGDYYNSFF